MNKIPEVFTGFFQENKAVRRFLQEPTWGDGLRDHLTRTDPHWKILAWKEFPRHKAVAMVAASTIAGTDLYVFQEGLPKAQPDLGYWTIDEFYDGKIPNTTAYWHFIGAGLNSDSEELLAGYSGALELESRQIEDLLEGKIARWTYPRGQEA
jgi:hypothetical protein